MAIKIYDGCRPCKDAALLGECVKEKQCSLTCCLVASTTIHHNPLVRKAAVQ